MAMNGSGGTRSCASAGVTKTLDGTGNLSKQRRDDLVKKLGAIRGFLEKSAPGDTNVVRLLKFAAELEKEVRTKKYGLVFEEHKERVDVELEHNLPVLTENKKRFIDNGGDVNVLIEGDSVTLNMEMRTKLVEANPLVEEARGQVAVQRGPIIYCLESQDLNGASIDNIALPFNATFRTVETTIDGSRIIALETEAYDRSEASWSGKLYREVGKDKKKTTVRLVPYYAWGNRGDGEMTVWIPVAL